MKRRAVLPFLLLVGVPLLPGQQSEDQKRLAQSSYFRDVWPIIQRRCQGCHQPALKRGNLDLTDYQGFQAGGKGGHSLGGAGGVEQAGLAGVGKIPAAAAACA